MKDIEAANMSTETLEQFKEKTEKISDFKYKSIVNFIALMDSVERTLTVLSKNELEGQLIGDTKDLMTLLHDNLMLRLNVIIGEIQ